MATSNNPLAPNPETNIDNPGILPDEPQEDLGKGVPLGEPDEEGFEIEEEDPEYGPPEKRKDA